MTLQVYVRQLRKYVGTVPMDVFDIETDEVVGVIDMPILTQDEADVCECPLTVWASDNGYAVDDLYLGGD